MRGGPRGVRWRPLLLVATLALVPRLLIAWELPLGTPELHPDCAPDEGLQYWTVMRYADGDVATWPESGSIYSAFPPIAYAAHAATLAVARAVPGGVEPERFPSAWRRLRRYAGARLGGVLLGCLTAVLAAVAAEAWTRSHALAVASGAAVALHPQLVFVNGYVNADTFTIAAVAALVVASSRWATDGEGRAGIAAVGAAAGLVLLGKPNGWAALVPTAVWIAHAARRSEPRVVAVATVAAFAVAGPVLAGNALRNGGDPFGLAKYRELLATQYRASPGGGDLLGFAADLARSSFAVFRHADLPLPGAYHAGAAAFVLLGLALIVRAVPRPLAPVERRALAWLAATLAIEVALVVWNGWAIDRQPQGRYLLPALVPGMAFLTCVLGATPGRRMILAGWLAFLGVATAAGLALVHAHPCV